MIMPGWQYPHCATSSSSHARWHGCEPSADSPSIVVNDLPAAASIVIVHDRTARSFCSTVHAPHTPAPHPYFVPVRFRRSRSTHSNGIAASASMRCDVSLTMIVKTAMRASSIVWRWIADAKDDRVVFVSARLVPDTNRSLMAGAGGWELVAGSWELGSGCWKLLSPCERG